MKNLLKFSLFAFFLLSDFVLFAQDPGDTGDGNGGLEGGDPAPAPINGKIIFLFITALLFAVYTLNNKRRKA